MISPRARHTAMNYVEVISNLAYLIDIEAGQPDHVRRFAGELQQQALELGQFLRALNAANPPGWAEI